MEFKPALLNIDEPFNNDKIVYGEDPKEIEALVDLNMNVNKTFIKITHFI